MSKGAMSLKAQIRNHEALAAIDRTNGGTLDEQY